MRGGFQIICAPDAAGRSALVRQYVSAPMHISKPWWDKGLLIVNAINSTAGLFAGDEIDTWLEVKSGAQLLLTSPSATRAHRMPDGCARVRQSVSVESGAWLEILPAQFIPHAGSAYSQESTIHLASGARFLWFESFTPGRVASGEAWQFRRFETRFHVFLDGRPVVRDVYAINPDSLNITALRAQFPTACHASIYAFGADFPPTLLAAIHALHGPRCWIGATRLNAPAIAIRLAAANNLFLTRALASIRPLLHQSFHRPVPLTRRN